MSTIRIDVAGISIEAELTESVTALTILKNLPLKEIHICYCRA